MDVGHADITGLLAEFERGDPGAEERLYALLYNELRRNASAILRRKVRPGRPGDTLQTTALVHEAYILFRKQRTPPRNRGHFFGILTQCMRRALADYIKGRKAKKRGGEYVHVSFDPQRDGRTSRVDLDLLLDALDALEREYPSDDAPAFAPKALMATLRLLLDWPVDEIADHLALPPDEVERHWTYARAFVRRFLAEKKT